MDDAHVPNVEELLPPGAPLVVVFFRRSDDRRLCARIRDVQSQEQWIVRDAGPLRDLLAKPPQ